ncbi:hypothetical protein PCE1_004824 [Barthelona sp. PCE]
MSYGSTEYETQEEVREIISQTIQQNTDYWDIVNLEEQSSALNAHLRNDTDTQFNLHMLDLQLLKNQNSIQVSPETKPFDELQEILAGPEVFDFKTSYYLYKGFMLGMYFFDDELLAQMVKILHSRSEEFKNMFFQENSMNLHGTHVTKYAPFFTLSRREKTWVETTQDLVEQAERVLTGEQIKIEPLDKLKPILESVGQIKK